MDGYQNYAAPAESGLAAAGERRSFLFLQGPISDFFDRLGRALIARGHRVHRINLHLGDQLFWRLPATHFRGHFDEWRGFLGGMLEAHQVTDLVLHGDRRPYHLVAAEEARARGITVTATDLGYVRPDWITLERDGMSTYSRFPREPASIRALAEEFPPPDLTPRFHTPFWLISVLDILYNLGLVFGGVFYPRYRYHGISHPFAEYAGWVWSRGKRLVTGRAGAAEKARLQAMPGGYFLFPLQLATDFQIRAHSPYSDVRDAIRDVVASFARSGCRKKLALVVHPLDNGLVNWCRLTARLARECGVAEQVLAFEGGIPAELLANAAGIVTINSTVGTTALYNRVPVKVLGNAVFDIPGLTSQQPLDEFWQDPATPDPALTAAFFRALAGTTQVKGGYYTRAAQAGAIAGFVERLEGRLHPLPPLDAADLAARPVRSPARGVVVAGVADGIGLALARAQAMPGVRLCLIGAGDVLADAADDCRRRGAIVDMLDSARRSDAEIADALQTLDREIPVDIVAVHVESDLDPAMVVVDALGEALRRRRRGNIVLVGARSEELLRYGRSVQQSLRPDGVSVAIASPGLVASRLAARLRRPEIAAMAADRAARLISRAVLRRRETVALPGMPTAMLRLLRLSPALLRDWARRSLAAPAEPAVDPIEEGPLPEESGSAD
jgi:capsular polysaccharide export protein